MAALPVLPRPADPKRGTYRRCGRCKGTGEARFNHLNGDTYCYLCDGRGWQLVFSAAERATIEAEQAWWADAYHLSYDLRLKVERAARKSEEARRGYVYKVDPGLYAVDPKAARVAAEDPEREATRRLARRTARLVTFWITESMHPEVEAAL